MTSDLDRCRDQARQGFTLIPLMRRLVADDLTPVGVLARCREEPYAFLFESVVGGERVARFSMLGLKPVARLVGDLQGVTLHRADGTSSRLPGDPYSAIRAYLKPLSSPPIPGLPRFSGGLVGYFSYDSVRLFESLPDGPPDHLHLPDLHLLRFDTVLVFDHSFNHLLLITHLDLSGGADVDSAFASAQRELDELTQRLQTPLAPQLVEVSAPRELTFSQHTSQAVYEAGVRKIQEYIRAGDVFQVVLSQRLSAPCDLHPFQVYRSLRSLNPSPYLFYLRLGAASLVGASPEIMVRVDEGVVTVRPIAGTAARGATPAEDEALAQALLADPKELAEHTMLIDLGRNDVGRVAKPGSVTLVERMVIERYSHVQHIVSHIEGRLATGLDALDAVRCCHPAGTVSGAPKVRAMEIIDELEPTRRGPYAGAVGYVGWGARTLDTAIAIRTVVLRGGRAWVQAGAGIVADSDPLLEWRETEAKARAVLAALGLAGARGR